MKKFYAVLVTLSLCGALTAQSIFDNPITGTNPNTANPYTTGQTVDANLSVSGIGRGTGIASSNANDRYNANGWNSASFDANDYFEFTITPNSGKTVSFTSFVFTLQNSNTGPTSANLSLRSSLDGFTASIGTLATATNPVLQILSIFPGELIKAFHLL